MVVAGIDPDSTWGVLLDGAVGGVIGALATVGAVYVALRHERALRAREGFEDEVTQMAALGRRLVDNVGRAALRLSDDLAEEDEATLIVRELFLKLARLHTLARRGSRRRRGLELAFVAMLERLVRTCAKARFARRTDDEGKERPSGAWYAAADVAATEVSLVDTFWSDLQNVPRRWAIASLRDK